VPTLRCCYAIYAEKGAPTATFSPPATGTSTQLVELHELVTAQTADELFGPHAQAFVQCSPRRLFLLSLSREVRGGVGAFFTEARRVLLEACAGVSGFGLDVLRLWPFPLEQAAEALPEEPLAEDLFSVGFTEMGAHGYRAETVGLAKLEQREISFEFTGRELLEAAALMGGPLADWVMDHGHRVQHGQSMAYGFDRLVFVASEGDAGGTFRGWHPPLVQRLLPEAVFPGVGVLDVRAPPEASGEAGGPLTQPLQRALEQRLVLEEHDLTGDSPFRASTARVRGSIDGLRALLAFREEPEASKDSGWRLFSRAAGDGPEEGVVPLGDVCRRAPELIRYLALPSGVRLEWDLDGRLTLDAARARSDIDDDSDDDLD
jgi:hypothetical protein